MCVGQKIKRYINENGVTQTHISHKSGIALPKLNLALNGSRRMTFEEYELICGVLNVNTDKFLEPRTPE
ncbi:MAG: helix-turn-helix domain-containing protein [Anaerocolumna sp.]